PLTSFVGREQELEKLEALLGSHRLVTVTGPGGAGKTRVATEVVRRVQGLFPDGTWVVELGSLTEPELVAHQTARTLEVADSPGLDVVEAIRAQIGSARMLVVLDNCEHVLDAAALVAAGMLESCPNLQVLATSRQRLDVLGEKVYQLPPLGLPAPGAAPADTAASDAVALFADRARLVYESFELDASSASEVAEICRHLDGLPLAIELAAAHADSLTPSEIGERLADRFAFLSRGNRAAPERQQGLRAVLDWGWELLDEAERDLLSGLSVFAGGWTLESAQEVTGAGPGLPARLARLAARSFVNVTSEGQTSRYGLLETVRLYAWDRLHAAGSAPGLVQAHARWSVRLAEQAAGGIRGPDVAPWLERMETEHDNFRAALRRCLQGDVGTAVELAGWLSFFWERRGHVTEGTAWLQEVLAAAPGDATAELARALSGAAYLAEAEGEYHRAQSLNQSALDVYRSLQDRPGQCQSLSDLGNVLRALRDMAGAETAHAESLQLARDLGDDYAIQRSLTNLANVWLDSGDLQRARVAYEEALPVAERIGNVVGAVGLRNNLAQIVGELGDWEAARALAAETMRAARATGDVMALLIAISAGEVDAMRRGEFQEARKLLEEGLELARGANVRLHVGACLHDLGVIEAREGNPEESAARYREAWQIFRDIGADARAIASLGNLFQLTVERGDMRQAADMAREALGLQSGAEAHLLARPLEMAATVASLAGEDEAAAGLFAASAAVASAAPVSTESSPSTERAAQRERMIESLRKRMGSGFAVAWDRGEAMDRERAMEVAASVTQLP
ncbi:MAG TPA: tetratricopeptide repeat protein, partial [Actinomycetota bacterium]|nr:tetratricopeptide repeat protein [Actinomycetota bacterium]